MVFVWLWSVNCLFTLDVGQYMLVFLLDLSGNCLFSLDLGQFILVFVNLSVNSYFCPLYRIFCPFFRSPNFYLILFLNLFLGVEKNLFFVTNLKFSIPISLQPHGVNNWFFKLRLFDLTEFIVWNIYDMGLHRYRDKKIRVCGKE